MKIKLDNKTLRNLMIVCMGASTIKHDNKVINAMILEELEAVYNNCKRKEKQKAATIKVSASQLLSLQILLQAHDKSPLTLVIKDRVVNVLMSMVKD